MKNASLKQLNKEVADAKGMALKVNTKKDGYRFETSDRVSGSVDYGEFFDAGNSLTDIVAAKTSVQNSGKQTIPPMVNSKIEAILHYAPTTYKIMGLYYAGEFTVGEIADILDISHQSVSKALRKAKEILKERLFAEEYDSIRWLLRDPKPIPSTVKRGEWKGYLDTYNCQGREPFPYHQ
jgi:DNA-directed RNA polymerase specialized sigma subunit